MKTILCYGDSNTWGYIPNVGCKCSARYSLDKRWTGILHKKLENEYLVIEEGLNGRTTNIDYHIPPDRNGETYLPTCLYSHAPIDLVILALGGNDLKIYFDRKPYEIKDGLRVLINIIKESRYGANLNSSPQILIISTPIPREIAESIVDENDEKIF